MKAMQMNIDLSFLIKCSWWLKPLLIFLGFFMIIPRMVNFVFKEVKKITLIDAFEFAIMLILLLTIIALSAWVHLGRIYWR